MLPQACFSPRFVCVAVLGLIALCIGRLVHALAALSVPVDVAHNITAVVLSEVRTSVPANQERLNLRVSSCRELVGSVVRNVCVVGTLWPQRHLLVLSIGFFLHKRLSSIVLLCLLVWGVDSPVACVDTGTPLDNTAPTKSIDLAI